MRKTVTFALLSTLLALLLLSYPAARAEAATEPTAAEKRIVTLVNAQRAKHGLKAVTFRATIIRAARAHSRDMGNRSVLTHTSSNGDSVGKRLIRFGYTPSGYSSWSVGECIARATSGSVAATPEGVVALWMKSAAHRAVILTAKWRDVGVGCVYSDDGRRYLTLDFGRRIR